MDPSGDIKQTAKDRTSGQYLAIGKIEDGSNRGISCFFILPQKHTVLIEQDRPVF